MGDWGEFAMKISSPDPNPPIVNFACDLTLEGTGENGSRAQASVYAQTRGPRNRNHDEQLRAVEISIIGMFLQS